MGNDMFFGWTSSQWDIVKEFNRRNFKPFSHIPDTPEDYVDEISRSISGVQTSRAVVMRRRWMKHDLGDPYLATE